MVSLLGKMLVTLAFFTVVSYIYPGVGPSDTASTIISVITLLYSILSGFFISVLWTRYLDIRQNVSKETSLLIVAHKLACDLNEKKFTEKFTELLDRYLRSVIDHDWLNYHKTDALFYEFYDLISMVKNKKTYIFQQLIVALAQVVNARGTLSILGKSALGRDKKALLYVLSTTLIFAIFYSKTPTLPSNIVSTVVSSAVVLVIFIINNIDTVEWGYSSVSVEPYEDVFDRIGMPRYYHHEDLKKGLVPPPAKEHRIGKHPKNVIKR